MDVVRSILFAAEADRATVDDIDPVVVAYHVRILDEGGMIYGSSRIAKGLAHGMPPAATTDHYITALRWQGHELLDAIRNDSLWEKAKQAILKEGSSWTIGILKKWIEHWVESSLLLGNSE